MSNENIKELISILIKFQEDGQGEEYTKRLKMLKGKMMNAEESLSKK